MHLIESWLQFQTSPSGGELRSISRSDSTLSAQSMPLSSSLPELLVGLSYNNVTGHLKVEVAKGSRFRSPGVNRPVDTFVKLALLSSNAHELSRAKTSVRRAQPNPVFRENFLFPVRFHRARAHELPMALAQIYVLLMAEIYHCHRHRSPCAHVLTAFNSPLSIVALVNHSQRLSPLP